MKHQWLEWRKNRVRLNKSKAMLRLKNDAVVYTTTTTEITQKLLLKEVYYSVQQI